MTTSERGVSCVGLAVRRGEFRLGPLDLDLAGGTVTCLVGPNGSGKTTLLRAVMGLVPIAAGEVWVDGRLSRGRSARVLADVGYAADGADGLIAELTAQELWDLHSLAHAELRGSVPRLQARAAELARTLDFVPPRLRISALSHGMQKKTQLVAALLHDPSVVVLDEPRNGLDPIGIQRLEDLVVRSAQIGSTVLIATHDLRFAERIADQVVILHRGRVLRTGRPDAIRAGDEADLVEAFFALVDAADVDDAVDASDVDDAEELAG